MTEKGKRFAVLNDFPEPAVEAAWRECLANGDLPTHFVSPEFFLEPPIGGEKRFAVLALESHADRLRVTGVLTGVRDGQVVRSGQIGTPQICVDKAADPQVVCQAFLEGLNAVSKSADLTTVYSWFPIEAFARAGYRESVETGSAALDISAGPDKTFARLKGRSQIRHAIAKGVQVRQFEPEDLPAYYAILKEWSERKELPCPSLEYLRASFGLQKNRRLFVALFEGKVIAGTPVRFYSGATAEYAWNVSLPEYQHLRPNDLLHWRIIEWACAEGIHTYLLGATHTFLLKYSDRIMPTRKYMKDRTLLRRYTLKQEVEGAVFRLYRALPPGIKEKLKRLRG